MAVVSLCPEVFRGSLLSGSASCDHARNRENDWKAFCRPVVALRHPAGALRHPNRGCSQKLFRSQILRKSRTPRLSALPWRKAHAPTAILKTAGGWAQTQDTESLHWNHEFEYGEITEPPQPLPPPPKDTSFLSILAYLWGLAASDTALKWRLATALVLLVLSKISGLAGPMLFKKAVDTLADVPGGGLPPSVTYTAVTCLVLAGSSKALAALLTEARYLIFTPVGQATGRRVALHFYDHILHLGMDFHVARKTGTLSRIIDRGKRSVTMIFRAVIFTFVPTMVELVLVSVLLARHVSTSFALAVLSTFFFYFMWTIALTKAASASRKELNTLDNLTTSKVVDALLNIETVVQFNAEALEARVYDRQLQAFQGAAVQAERVSALLNGGQSLILAGGLAVVMAMAGARVAQGLMTVGDLVFVNGLILQLSVPLQFLGFLYRDLRQSLVDMEQMFAIMSTPPSVSGGGGQLAATGEGAAVAVADVVFSYGTRGVVLRGVSLRAEPGESVALVGPSGSGKSTIVKLLLRLYDPDAGTLKIDGVDITTLTVASLRSAVAVVPQDTVLFNNTIRHNIRYGRPGATDEEVEWAARQARLHESILRMPEGYETMVGERGLKLSGGEKQRVAIARAFLKSPRLLICDEATSALDSATEVAILKSLKELAAGRTCLFVAHRLSTIMHCDRIMVIEGGEVLEEGSHHDLLDRNGRYAHMWRLQELTGAEEQEWASPPRLEALQKAQRLLENVDINTIADTDAQREPEKQPSEQDEGLARTLM